MSTELWSSVQIMCRALYGRELNALKIIFFKANYVNICSESCNYVHYYIFLSNIWIDLHVLLLYHLLKWELNRPQSEKFTFPRGTIWFTTPRWWYMILRIVVHSHQHHIIIYKYTIMPSLSSLTLKYFELLIKWIFSNKVYLSIVKILILSGTFPEL